jgi:putative flippase GtrA
MRRPQVSSLRANRLLRFTLVGVGNTAVTLVSYAILLDLGVQYALAGGIGWTLGVLNGYTWNRIWTFGGAAHRIPLLVRYVAVGALGLGLNTGLLGLLVGALDMDKLAAELVALPVVLLTTFAINRYWVFAEDIGGQ